MWPHGEEISRVRASKTLDPMSGELTEQDWTGADVLVIAGCGVAPTSSSDPSTPDRSPTLSRCDVYVPFGGDVAASDRLVIRGETWLVDGDPQVWSSPLTGWAPGVKVSALKMAG